MTGGWQTMQLGELCDVLDYKRKPITKRDRIEGEYPYYGATGILGYVEGFLFNEPLVLVGEDGAKWQSGENTAFSVEGKIWVNNHAHVLRPHRTKLLDSWLIYHINHLDLTEFVSGLTVPKLNQGSLREIPVPLPPLPEQKRIVGILDQAFERIATAKANCEKNLQNARALFESHLNAVFTQRGEAWVDSTIGTEIKFIDYRGRTPVKTSSGIRLITAKNVKMGYLQETPMEFIASAGYKGWMTRGIPQKGDVLFTTEAPLANVAQLDTDEKVAFAQRIIIMQPNAAKLDSGFLKYLLLSQLVQQRIRTKGTGATVQGIKASLLKTIEISFPKSLDDQRQIVAKLDSLSEETQRLESLYQRKLAALDELKKSLLHQAFSGQLTTKFSLSAVVPFPVKLPKTNTTDLHAGILAMAYQHHEQKGNPKHFGHVKAEKIAHMVEAYVGIDLGRQPIKDAAGPNDYPHLKNKVESRARKAGYFDFQPTTEAGGYRVTKLRQFDALIEKTRAALGDHVQAVDRLLDLLLPMNTQQAEVMCTVYAGWNNLLLEGRQPSDEEIVYESRENWHEAKLKIPREKFFAAIGWLKEKNIIPHGKGLRVLARGTKK